MKPRTISASRLTDWYSISAAVSTLRKKWRNIRSEISALSFVPSGQMSHVRKGTENILLGLDDPKFVMNIHKYEKQVRALGKENNLEVDPSAFIWQLTVGEQQRVEILKMLYRGCDILIMDEPTAVLAPQEIEVLFNTLRTMTANGKSIIFISHKLNEILEIADRVTVLRHGKITAEDVSTRDITREDLASLMVGRKVIFSFDKNPWSWSTAPSPTSPP